MGCWVLPLKAELILHHQHDAPLHGHMFARIHCRCDGMSTPQNLVQYDEHFDTYQYAYQM
jgi:hypothetical protein